jgi:hypothetical protein
MKSQGEPLSVKQRWRLVFTGQDVGGRAIEYSPQYVIGGLRMTRLTVINLESDWGGRFQFFRVDGVQIVKPRSMIIDRGKLYIDDPNLFLLPGEGQMVAGYVRITSDMCGYGSTALETATGSRSRPLFADASSAAFALASHVARANSTSPIAIVNPDAATRMFLLSCLMRRKEDRVDNHIFRDGEVRARF